MEIVEEEVALNEKKFKASIIETKNAVISLFYEEEPRLGTLAVAMPSFDHPEINTSSILLGERNITTTRVLAEGLSKEYGKIALVSTSFKKEEYMVTESLGKLLKKIIARHSTKENEPKNLLKRNSD